MEITNFSSLKSELHFSNKLFLTSFKVAPIEIHPSYTEDISIKTEFLIPF